MRCSHLRADLHIIRALLLLRLRKRARRWVLGHRCWCDPVLRHDWTAELVLLLMVWRLRRHLRRGQHWGQG